MQRSTARELIDEPIESLAELEGSLRDIAFVNAAFGGIAPIAREIERTGARTVLDVGSGLADVPFALVRRARRRGRTLAATCLDRSTQMLALAKRFTGADPDLHFVHGEGEALPFADGAFDVTTCSLALHHCDPPVAVALLRELRRVASVTPVVCDLRRSRLGYAVAYLWSHLGSRNRLTRNDASLSILRSYTPDEALSLARAAGWRAPRVVRDAFFRMTLVDG
jgi:SAM-dependent methyltransferase